MPKPTRTPEHYQVIDTVNPLPNGFQYLIYDSQFGPIGGPAEPSNVLCDCTSKEYAEQIVNALNAALQSPAGEWRRFADEKPRKGQRILAYSFELDHFDVSYFDERYNIGVCELWRPLVVPPAPTGEV